MKHSPSFTLESIKAIIGLGNPGKKFEKTRHNIGFIIVDALGEKESSSWHDQKNLLFSEILIHGKKILLIKPQTFMNKSGEVLSFLTKKGIKPEEILVIHDELEKPFGSITFKFDGSAKGHNGLRSLMQYMPSSFWRLRFGIGRPEKKEDVGNYVLSNFTIEEAVSIESLVTQLFDEYFK